MSTTLLNPVMQNSMQLYKKIYIYRNQYKPEKWSSDSDLRISEIHGKGGCNKV